MGINPPKWTAEEFEREAAQAIRHFRETRMHEPLEAYLDYVEEYRRQVETLIEETVDLTRLSNLAVELLTNPQRLTAIRYLASPAISEDDLKVLADAALTPKRLNAVVSTAALIATQKVQTGRRNEAKKTQEGAVADALRAAGFTEAPTRAVTNMSHLPAHGEFCAEALFGSRKADLIVRLWDGRVMPTECKVSNSSTNSVKRLNNDAAVKARTWIQEFGTVTCVPAAVLSGVFKTRNLISAQADGLTLFWAHGLDRMIAVINSTREAGR